MSAVRMAVHVGGLVLAHLAISSVIGAVLLFGYAGWQLLTGAAP